MEQWPTIATAVAGVTGLLTGARLLYQWLTASLVAENKRLTDRLEVSETARDDALKRARAAEEGTRTNA